MSKEGNRDFKVSYSSFWVEVEDKKKKKCDQALHLQPIDLVVFKEPSSLRNGYLVLGWASRLYAFSVYPFRS